MRCHLSGANPARNQHEILALFYKDNLWSTLHWNELARDCTQIGSTSNVETVSCH